MQAEERDERSSVMCHNTFHGLFYNEPSKGVKSRKLAKCTSRLPSTSKVGHLRAHPQSHAGSIQGPARVHPDRPIAFLLFLLFLFPSLTIISHLQSHPIDTIYSSAAMQTSCRQFSLVSILWPDLASHSSKVVALTMFMTPSRFGISGQALLIKRYPP